MNKRTNEYRLLPIATKQETIDYLNKAKEFLLKTNGLYHPSGEGRTAIADYLAFSDGKQLLRN
jgi:hypothetical protein